MLNADLLNVPYRWAGTFPEGTDCFGLMVEVRRRCGIPTPDFSWVYQQWDESSFDPHQMLTWAEQFQASGSAPGAFTFREAWRGPALVTTDGTSAFFISPRLRVQAIPTHELRGAQWRI